MFAKFSTTLLILCITLGSVSMRPMKRLTCEFGHFIGDAGCAAHCVYLNHTGGWCDSKNYCHCKPEWLFPDIFGRRAAKKTSK